MGVGTKAKTRTRKPSVSRIAAERKEAKRRKDHDETRRKLYLSNADYRERVKDSSRRTYRKSNPKGDNPLKDREPRAEATVKSVQHVSGGDPFMEGAYSLNQAAAALGKAQLTFKRWVSVGIVPEPVYIDTSYKYQQYLGWEVEAIIGPIADHFDKFDYLLVTHEDTIGEIWSALNHARVERGRYHGSKKEK